MRHSIATNLLSLLWMTQAFAFIPAPRSTVLSRNPSSFLLKSDCVSRDGKDPSDDDDNEKDNYPFDLEFIDYDDPNYTVDQGLVEGEEFYNPAESKAETEREIEKMREERRKQNDLFQFNTYFTKFVKEKEWHGVWTEYKTSTFMDNVAEKDKVDANGLPKLAKGRVPLKVISSGTKEMLDPWGPENEVIIHNESVHDSSESKIPFCPPLRM